MFCKLLFYSVRICSRFIHLVDRNDDRYSRSLRVADGFDGLRHNAVVRRNYQYRNIRDMGSSGTHCRERFVTRCVQEYDLLSVDIYLRCTDVLGDAAGFGCRNICFSDCIKQRRLTVVNMAHNGDNRSTMLQVFFFVLEKFESFFLFGFFHLAYHNADSQIVCKDHNRILIDVLVHIRHNSHLHERHDDGRNGYPYLFAETCHGDRCGNRNGSGRKFFKDIFLLHNRLFRFVVLLRFCLFFKGALLHSVFVLFALASALFKLCKFISFLFRMFPFFRVFLVRLCFHLGKGRTVVVSRTGTSRSLSAVSVVISALRSAVSAGAVVSRSSALTTAVSAVSIVSTTTAVSAVSSVPSGAAIAVSATLSVVSVSEVPPGFKSSGVVSRLPSLSGRLRHVGFLLCRFRFSRLRRRRFHCIGFWRFCLWRRLWSFRRRSFCCGSLGFRRFRFLRFGFCFFCFRYRSFSLRCLYFLVPRRLNFCRFRLCHRLSHWFCHRLSHWRTISRFQFFIYNRFPHRRPCLRSVLLCLSCLRMFVCAKGSHLSHACRLYGSSRLFIFLAVSLFRGCLDNRGFLCIIFFRH